MTENEAVEIININLHQGNLTLALDIAKKSITELQQYRAIGTVEEIEGLNFSSNQLRLVNLVEEYKEKLKGYEAIGTIEECREARKRQKIEEDADPVRQIVSIPSTEEAFKSALRRATTTQINEALRRMGGKNGKRARIAACMGELRKRRKEQEKALAAYKVIQNYCNNRETCDGCLFEMEDGTPGVCIMEFQDIPAEWQELELDEPAAYK